MESDAKDAGWFTLRNFSIFMAALAATWFAPVLFGGQSFVYRDFAYFGYPMAFHHRDAFWQGELPLWNPLNHCGLPFLAQWNAMVFYPGSLIYLLLPPLYGTNLFSVAHLWLAGVAMFWLAREWFGNGFAAAIAGVGFAISGLTLNSVLWPNNIAALGWMPLVVGLACGLRTRRKFVLAVAVGAMQMLTGAPEIILLTWATIFVLVIVQAFQAKQIQPMLGLIGLGFFVAALCAAQLLPFLDLARISQRTANFGGSFWAMPLWGWANFFVPLVYTYDLAGVRFQYDQLWTSTYYPSIALTVLGIIGLFGWHRLAARERALYGILFFSVALAMGPAAYVYSFLKVVLPGLGLIRFPIKFVVPVLFCLPLLAAAVVTRVPDLLRAPARKYTWMIIAAAIVGIVAYAKGHPKFDPPYDNWPLTLRSGLITLCFASVAVALLANQHVPKLRLMVILLIPLDIYLHTPNPARTVDREAFAPFVPPPVSREGRAMLTKRAWDTLYNEAISDTRKNLLLNRVALNADLNLIEKVAKIDGFFSLNMAESERTWRRASGCEISFTRKGRRISMRSWTSWA
jgi:hypothetical protein